MSDIATIIKKIQCRKHAPGRWIVQNEEFIPSGGEGTSTGACDRCLNITFTLIELVHGTATVKRQVEKTETDE